MRFETILALLDEQIASTQLVARGLGLHVGSEPVGQGELRRGLNTAKVAPPPHLREDLTVYPGVQLHDGVTRDVVPMMQPDLNNVVGIIENLVSLDPTQLSLLERAIPIHTEGDDILEMWAVIGVIGSKP